MARIDISNSGSASTVNVGPIRLYFSYSTLIAVDIYDRANPERSGRVVSENIWSNTTGKHLSAIDGGHNEAKAKRLPRDKFDAEVAAMLARYGIA